MECRPSPWASMSAAGVESLERHWRWPTLRAVPKDSAEERSASTVQAVLLPFCRIAVRNGLWTFDPKLDQKMCRCHGILQIRTKRRSQRESNNAITDDKDVGGGGFPKPRERPTTKPPTQTYPKQRKQKLPTRPTNQKHQQMDANKSRC